jgi:hypothetical protein
MPQGSPRTGAGRLAAAAPSLRAISGKRTFARAYVYVGRGRAGETRRRRGPDWMPITPKTGSLFHAYSQIRNSGALSLAIAPLCVSRVPVGHRPGHLRGDQT